jgi:hypothetical protein
VIFPVKGSEKRQMTEKTIFTRLWELKVWLIFAVILVTIVWNSAYRFRRTDIDFP